MLFHGNKVPYLGSDETALSNRKFYTVLAGKEGKGQKGILIAITERRETSNIIAVINRIPGKERLLVKIVTSAKTGSMNKIVKYRYSDILWTIYVFCVFFRLSNIYA